MVSSISFNAPYATRSGILRISGVFICPLAFVMSFAIGLWLAGSGLELCANAFQELSDARLLHIRETLPVDAWGSAIFLRLVEGRHMGDVGE